MERFVQSTQETRNPPAPLAINLFINLVMQIEDRMGTILLALPYLESWNGLDSGRHPRSQICLEFREVVETLNKHRGAKLIPFQTPFRHPSNPVQAPPYPRPGRKRCVTLSVIFVRIPHHSRKLSVPSRKRYVMLPHLICLSGYSVLALSFFP